MWSSFLVMQEHAIKLNCLSPAWKSARIDWRPIFGRTIRLSGHRSSMATFTTTWWTNLVSNLLLSFFRCRKIVPEYYPRCRFRDNLKYDGISCRSSASFSGEAMKNYKSLQAHQFFRSGFVGPVRRGSWYCKVCRLKKKQTV